MVGYELFAYYGVSVSSDLKTQIRIPARVTAPPTITIRVGVSSRNMYARMLAPTGSPSRLMETTGAVRYFRVQL